MSEGKEVVSWADRLAAEAKQVVATEQQPVTGLSFRNGVMSLAGVPVPGSKMDVLVLGYVFENRYFKDRFDADKKADPLCFSLSMTGEDMVPHDASGEKQGDACAYDHCPKFEWKSDPVTGKGKACKEIRRLILLPASVLKDGPDAIKRSELAFCTIPVTSVRNWASYVNRVAAEYQLPPWAVMCTIACAPHAKKQLEVTFTPVAGVVKDEILTALDSKREEAVRIAMEPYQNSGGEPQKADPSVAQTRKSTKY